MTPPTSFAPKSTFSVVYFTFLIFSSDAASAPEPQYGDSFWKHWGDGQAELAGYALTYNRYGEAREGVAVSVFVTETFSESARVKADPGRHPKEDEYPVLKLNLMQDFPTGVYDYNMMTSAFVQLQPRLGRAGGAPTKISFSSQEWCGHVYQQLVFAKDAVQNTSHSYFDGEADQRESMKYPPGGMSADTLLVWARGLAGPVLRSGESVVVPLLTSLERSRLDHRPAMWTEATLMRSNETTTLTVPAGTFDVSTLTARLKNGLEYTFFVESVFPHRVVRWTTSRGDDAKLLGDERMKYWQLNGRGGQEFLAKLGLSPRAVRSP